MCAVVCARGCVCVRVCARVFVRSCVRAGVCASAPRYACMCSKARLYVCVVAQEHARGAGAGAQTLGAGIYIRFFVMTYDDISIYWVNRCVYRNVY